LRAVLLALLATLAATPAPAETSLSLDRRRWTAISEGAVDLVSDATGLSFHFPVAGNRRQFSGDTINALISDYAQPLTAAESLSATFKLITTGTPVFNYVFERSNTCVRPAHTRLWFARPGWNQGGEFFRWWARSIAYQLGAGTSTLRVPLTPDQWTSVFGKAGNHGPAALAGFADALRDTGQVGLVFGGGCFLGHGVNVSRGTARFILTDYRIR
jgi:hypothetical protein